MIRLRLFGIPLEIGPSFFLVVILIGLPLPALQAGRWEDALAQVAIFGLVVTVSVVAHELGHALTARRFGAEVSMRLYALGGLTAWSGDPRLFTPGRRVVIAAAGSLVGLVIGGVAYGLALLGVLAPTGRLGRYALEMVILVNVVWGLINWLPVRPLDGGHILAGTLEAIWPKRGPMVADVVFLVTAVAGTVLAFRFGLLFAALLGLWLSFSEVQRFALRGGPPRQAPPPAPDPGEGFLFERPPPPSGPALPAPPDDIRPAPTEPE